MTESTAAYPLRQIRTWRVAVFVVFTVNGLAVAGWYSRFHTLRDILGAEPIQMSGLILCLALSSILGLVFAPRIIGRTGERGAIRLTLLISVAALVVLGFALQFGAFVPLIIAGLCLMGLSLGVCDVAMNLTGAHNEVAGGRTMMPMFHAAFSLGAAASAIIGFQAEALGISIAVHMWTLAAIVLIASLLAVPAIVDTPAIDTASEGKSTNQRGIRREVWRDKRTYLIGLVILGMALAEGSANDWLTIATVDSYGVDNATATLFLGVFLGAMTVGRVAGAFVIDRFGRVPVLFTCGAFAVIGMVLFIFSGLPAVGMIGVVLWGLGASLGFPVGMSAAADDPRTATARVSAVALIGYLAFLGGPITIGLLGDVVGVAHALIFVLVLVIVSVILSPAVRKPEPARP